MPEIISTCSVTGKRFRITEGEQAILQRVGESIGWIGESLPIPRLTPCEANRQIYCFGNFLFLSHASSALSGARMLSRYEPRLGYLSVNPEEFWSDAIDNRQFGRDYDFSRSFAEQFDELLRAVYHLSLSQLNVENSDYVNGAQNVKRCYLCFSAVECQDCYYCISQYRGNDNVDCVGSMRSQFCYSCVDIDNCYECQHCADCWNCRNSFGCFDCRNCQNCFGCVGLERAEFCLFNEQLTREKYEEALKNFGLNTHTRRQACVNQTMNFWANKQHKPLRMIQTENSTGSYLARCDNVYQSYHTSDSRDCGYLALSISSQDVWKGWASKSELCYSSGTYDARNVGYSYLVVGSNNILYSYGLYNGCANCFGSVCLKRNSYCILNKQYSKTEYFDRLPRIIRHMKKTGEWGNFMPPRISPHPYQECFARMFIDDIEDNQLKARGYRLDAVSQTERTVQNTGVAASTLPEDICSVDIAEFTGKVVRCEVSGECFKYQRPELEFYHRFQIPIPRNHWRVRLNRLQDFRKKMPDKLDVIDNA